MLTKEQNEYIANLLKDHAQYAPPYEWDGDDFFAVLRVIDEGTFYNATEDLMDKYENCSMFYVLKQPTFIERFMREVCKQGGVE